MKKRLAILFAAVLLLIIGAFAFHTNQKRWRTELEPLIKFFPVFSDAEDCCWKAGNYDSFFFVLGPSSAWLKGYIKLPAAAVNQLCQDYSWTPMEDTPYKMESCPGYPSDDVPWFFSQGFSVEVMMPQFVGQIYLNDQYGVVFFYAEFA